MYGGMHLFNWTTKPSTKKIVFLLFNSTSIISASIISYHWCCKNATITDPSAKAIRGQPKQEKDRPLNTTTIPDAISSSFRFNQS